MKKAVLLVLDGLGIGAMNDLKELDRSQDKGANTLDCILKENPELQLPYLTKMGLGKAAKNDKLKSDKTLASFGQAKLKYKGADTFMGHQEIMGSKVKAPKIIPFKKIYKKVAKDLINKGYKVEIVKKNSLVALIVNQAAVIADNIEADYGQIYNVTAVLDKISFAECVKIAKIVRNVAKVSRVIALGGPDISLNDIKNQLTMVNEKILGVKTTELDIYGPKYQVLHLGYGIDHKKQISSILAEEGYDVRLIGKVQDVINCPEAEKMIPEVYTVEVLEKLLNNIKEAKAGLIAANVQELDLAGHEQDAYKQAEVLQLVDKYLPKIVESLDEKDILIITADHGNDSCLSTSKHTRELTPILFYSFQQEAKKIQKRESLADIAATIAEFFDVTKPQAGQSFLNQEEVR